MSTAIYDRVKALCRERGITVTQLSRDAGLSEGTLKKWGCGDGTPRDVTVKRVAERLGVSTDYLRYGEERQNGPQSFAERLKALRLERGLTQRQLAKGIYCGEQSVRNWEHGKHVPQDDYASDLAAFFGVSRDYLMYGEEGE